MFENRLKNQAIEFMKFGTPTRLSPAHELRNGDSVKLKYGQFEIDVSNISITDIDNISGVIDAIENSNGDEVLEIGSPHNIQSGSQIAFKESNVFHCTLK